VGVSVGVRVGVSVGVRVGVSVGSGVNVAEGSGVKVGVVVGIRVSVGGSGIGVEVVDGTACEQAASIRMNVNEYNICFKVVSPGGACDVE
jgi:hypothetical protein